MNEDDTRAFIDDYDNDRDGKLNHIEFDNFIQTIRSGEMIINGMRISFIRDTDT